MGLGNPGPAYAATRHNLGFLVVEVLAARYVIALNKKTMGARWGQGQMEGEPVVLAQPTTYMNQSGRTAAQILHYFKLSPADLFVIHDDLDVPFGRLKLAQGGGAGGHRGVLSIQGTVSSPDFYRVKLGIGRPPVGMATEDFVLSPFTFEERESVGSLVERAAQAVITLITSGLTAAQNQFHRAASVPS